MPTLEDALAKMNRYSSGRAADSARGRAARRPGRGAAATPPGPSCAAMSSRRGFLDGPPASSLAVYVAEGTYWRYLKIAEHARRLPTKG